jgi:low temperature requirement protein LtrA
MAESNENSRTKNRPRLRTLEQNEAERHASWLELFFDLVFVLAVAQIAKMLAEHSDLVGTVKYIALFVPIWWTWMGFTFYADRFESDESAYRILMFAAMLAVAALALCLNNVFLPGGDFAFVICYVLVRLILTALYARAAYHVPLSRSYNLQFITGFSIAIALWLVSIFLPPPFRYILWTLAVIVELITPFFNVRKTLALPFDPEHIPERFGLFTIIVLGEAVVATANGASQTVWNFQTIAAASIGFAMAASIWWINFDFVEDSPLKSDRAFPRFIFLYGHFFIVASIVALGIGVEHAIKETGAGEGHLHFSTLALIGGGIAVYLATITAIKLAADSCSLLYARLASIAVSLLLLLIGQFIHPLISLLIFFFLLGFGVWLEDRFGVVVDVENDRLLPCQHADEMQIFEPTGELACEECVINNYKWVHLRLCTSCGHIGCCDSSQYKHATKHFHESDHPIISSLEPDENWAWCYADDRFVPLMQTLENKNINKEGVG